MSNFQDAFNRYAYLDLDEKSYGTIEADLKTVDSLGLTVGIDRKFTSGSTNQYSRIWHLGPSFNGTWTYTHSDVFAIAQNGTLGVPGQTTAANYKLYVDRNEQDSDFYCYTIDINSSFKPSGRLADIESLVNHEHPEVENFDRVWVDGVMTLAKWLETMSEQMVRNYLSQNNTVTESLIPGQINYSFILEVKPGFDVKYTLVSKLYNPFMPDLSVSRDDTSTFAIYLNTTFAKAAYGGKNGTAAIETPAKRIPNWPSSVPSPQVKKSAVPNNATTFQLPNRPKSVPHARPGGQTPGISFPAPLALPSPAPPGQ